MRAWPLAAACLLITAAVSAQTPPRWVRRGAHALNRSYADGRYRLRIFDTSGPDLGRLETERFRPLLDYVGAQYGADPAQMQLDSLGDGACTTYRISFPADGGASTVYARLVDDWSGFGEEPAEAGWNFELHQLYAISERDAAPEFDAFERTDRYPAETALLSIIPGLGQIRKGQPGKGYAIMGTEALFVGGIIYASVELNYYNRQAKRHPEVAGSYRSNAATFRQLRNVCLVAGGALYLYNLIDAAVARGARRVVIRRPNQLPVEVAFAPVAAPQGAGVGLAVTF